MAARFSKISFSDESYVFDFGKYKGLPLKIVMEKDIDYILWAERNVISFVLSDSLWKELLTRLLERAYSDREEKIKYSIKINDEIDKLSNLEKDKRRKKYFAEKAEREEDGSKT